MATLYELSSEYARLMGELEFAETDEQREEIYAAIFAIDGDLMEKADAYARIMRNKAGEAEMYKAEKQRFEQLQRAAENTVERMKQRMYDSMRQTDTMEIPTSIGKWRRQLNNPSVEILDEAAIPAEFRVPQPDRIDKNGILAYARTHEDPIPGANVVRTESLRFR